MQEYTAKIRALSESSIAEATSHLIMSDDRAYSLRERVRHFLLRMLFGVERGVVWVFRVTQSTYGVKLVLERLKLRLLIEGYGEGPLFADYPRIHFFGITFRIAPSEPLLHAWGYALQAEDGEDAMRQALWEVAERSSTYMASETQNVHYPGRVLGDASWMYPLVPHFTPLQSSYADLVQRAQDLKKVSGLTVPSPTGDRARFFPTHTIFWGSGDVHTSPFVHEATTNGCGGGATYETATVSALYELIERDHFLLHWFTNTPPPLIDTEDARGPLFDYVRNAEKRYQIEVRFFDMRYDMPGSSCACLLIDPVLNIVALGAKASDSVDVSLRGAYLEALATLLLVRSRGRVVPPSIREEIVHGRTWADSRVDRSVRVNMYNSPEGIACIKTLWCEEKKLIRYDDLLHSVKNRDTNESSYNQLIEHFKNLVQKQGAQYHVYAHRFDSDVARETKSVVVRAYVPALLKLHLTERFVAPLSDRIVSFAHVHGKDVKNERDLNYLPHPFP